MPKVLRHDVTQRTHNDWAIAIPFGLVIAGLLGLAAFYPMQAAHVIHAGQGAPTGPASAKSEPAPVAKKPVRYEATIENWKRYRAANQPAP